MDYTPVELVDNIWFKREDKYAPYGDDFISGGKIRQCRDLVEKTLTTFMSFVILLLQLHLSTVLKVL